MCQLFGVSAAQPVEVNAWLRTLANHSVEHPHGWGVAVFHGEAVNLEKEPLAAWQSSYLESRLKFPITTKNLIAHIRRASVGGMAYENCHPFVARDAGGRVWTLAHNGMLFEAHGTERYQAQLQGGTDSERILLHLMNRMNAALEQAQGSLSPRERFLVAERVVAELAPHNSLNLLFYDGELLYVHTNQPDHLCFRRVGDAVLFATVPMDDAHWEPVARMRLLAYRDGELLFQSEPHGYDYTEDENRAHQMDSSQL